MRKKVNTGSPLPKALACGMLEDNGRILFLLRKDKQGIEKIEMPSILVFSGRNPLVELKLAFKEQTGIDAQIGEIRFESKFNTGSRKRKVWVLCLVFLVTAKNRSAKPSHEFSGFKWLSLKDAKFLRTARNCEWLSKF